MYLNRLLLLIFLFGFGNLANAQKVLLVANDAVKGVTLIQTGAVVKFQFLGYAGQIQEFKGRVMEISDDSIFMEDLKLRNKSTFNLAVKDIIGFRGYSSARTLSKSLVELGLLGGNLFLYYGVVAPASIGAGPAILISLGSGLISYGILRVVYPDKIKKTTANGWSFKVITRNF